MTPSSCGSAFRPWHQRRSRGSLVAPVISRAGTLVCGPSPSEVGLINPLGQAEQGRADWPQLGRRIAVLPAVGPRTRYRDHNLRLDGGTARAARRLVVRWGTG